MTEAVGKAIRSNALTLGLVALCIALLLGLVHGMTGERIAQQLAAAERRALYELLPPSAHDNDLLADTLTLNPANNEFSDIALLGLHDSATAYIARQNGEVSGVILPAIARDGYSGDISLLVGVNRDGTISGVRVTRHNETPGLGDKIDLRVSDWILGFNGRSLEDPASAGWTVVSEGGEFDQFTGATITPRAVTVAVRMALEFFQNNREALLSR